jgi:FtsP/CotA-like multicopper oxidase with cupredoxin domain
MKHTTMTRLLRRSALVVALLGLLAGTASAQTTYNLVADQFLWDGVPMWGFTLDPGGPSCNTEPFPLWNPGPMLAVDAGGDPPNSSLTVNLRNCLPEAVSIVIPGQPLPAGSVPTFVTDGEGRERAASFTSEAAASGGTASYTWTGLKPGTYLYHSGSNPAKQVHMGLYGAAIVDYDTGEAYPGVFYDIDAVLVASEIDPALHATAETARPLNFKPKYFLVNGVADGSSALTGPAVGDRVLLRLVNAGLNHYVPNLLGEDLTWIAEDGNTYPYPKTSYSALLAAGKTLDALWTPVTDGPHYLYDRRLHLSTNGAPGGGLVASIDIAPTAVPIANAGPHQVHVPMLTGGLPTVVSLDGSASLTIGGVDCGTAGTCSYAWSLIGFPAGSAAALTGDTTATPSFELDEPGTYTVQLIVTEGVVASAPDVVNVFTNLPPVALAGADQAVGVEDLVALDGSASYDPDTVDTITSYDWQVTAPDATGFALSGATPTFTADQVGTYSAVLTVSDGELEGSDTVLVTASVLANQPPNAVNDYATVIWKTIDNIIPVLDNDSDPDGALVPSSLTVVTAPISSPLATAVPTEYPTGSGQWVIYYTPKTGWKGTDFFTYQVCDDGTPEECAEAEVWVNVVKN